MSMLSLALLALVQQPPVQTPPATLAPSPVERIVVTPAVRTVTAGDSIQLSAQAVDARGQPVPNAIIRFHALGGEGQAGIDSTGKIIASSVGRIPMNVVALVAGARPKFEPIEIRIVPGPAARVDIQTKVGKVVVGQQMRLSAIPFSKVNDRAHDAVRWSSSVPAVARVDADGVLSALTPGRAILTATAGSARA